MGVFRKKVRDRVLDEARLSGKAQKMATLILVFQSRWAAWLNAQSQKIGMKKTKVLLIALLLGFGCYCLWLVVNAFY